MFKILLVDRPHRMLYQAEKLINELGPKLNGKKLRKVMAYLDPEGEGVVRRADFIEWYKENERKG